MERVPFVLAAAPDLEKALALVPGCKLGSAAGMASILLDGADFFAWPLGPLEEMALYLVTPSSDDWEQGPALYRLLRKVALAEPKAIGGPWSPAEFAKVYPREAEAAFGVGKGWHLPHVVEGMAPELDVALDYSPTDADVRADAMPDRAKVMAPRVALEAAMAAEGKP